MPAAHFEYPGTIAQFPMNVAQTRFGDSVQEKQLQICDILAGACSAVLRFDKTDPRDMSYREKLLEAGIEKFFVAGLWPSTDMTPESLGRKGWDGNIALEWLFAGPSFTFDVERLELAGHVLSLAKSVLRTHGQNLRFAR